MDLNEFFTIIGTGIGVVGFLYAFMRNFKADIIARLDKMDDRMDKNETRIDHLYQICIEMLGTRHKH